MTQPLDERRFRDRMESSRVSAELFFPLGSSLWRDDRFVLRKEEKAAVRTQISGVRFQAADQSRENLAPERQCQADVVNLVDSVGRLRESPDMGNVVLSRDLLKCKQPGRADGTRVKFGLRRDEGERFQADADASKECHRKIVRAVKKSGYVVEHPKAYDAATGMAGLRDWGSELRLRRRKRPWWLLLLPLLLLLFLLKDQLPDPESFFGVPIETNSMIVLLDKSSSMTSHFPVVRAEAKNYLQRMLSRGDKHFANVIAYDAQATRALPAIEEVTKETSSKLMTFLDALAAGGGTNLRSGMEAAAEDVAKHEQPTTLVILTDGKDSSIRQMINDMPNLKSKFKGVEIVGNALTPRLFGTEADPQPKTQEEIGLSELADMLGGRFGSE